MTPPEKTAIFGKQRNLIGVITQPPQSAAGKAQIAAIVLNAGLVHRVGPNRLGVELSRELAKGGVLALRFDLSGIGDSTSLAGEITQNDRAISEIQSAMDHLATEHRIQKFILIGLCTGADNAHKTAMLDPRVIGAVFLDGYRFPTWKYYWRRYWPTLKAPHRLFRSISTHVHNLITTKAEKNVADDVVFGWRMPPKAAVEKDLRELVNRGVRLFYIFSGTVLECYDIKDFRRSFKSIAFEDLLSVVRFPLANHTYSFPEDRALLVKSINNWVNINFNSH